jgi:hypothetical protein
VRRAVLGRHERLARGDGGASRPVGSCALWYEAENDASSVDLATDDDYEISAASGSVAGGSAGSDVVQGNVRLENTLWWPHDVIVASGCSLSTGQAVVPVVPANGGRSRQQGCPSLLLACCRSHWCTGHTRHEGFLFETT